MSVGEPRKGTRRGASMASVTNVLVIALVAFALFRPSGPVAERFSDWRKERRVQGMISENFATIAAGPRLDSSTAPVALVEFSDYECPFCRTQHETLRKLVHTPNVGGVAFRYLPLSSHEHAEGAARSAICAERQGRFREMNERLFATSAWLKDTNWTREAQAAGVPDLAAFDTCRLSKETSARLKADLDLATQLGISGTPTFVHRGGVYQGVMRDTTFMRLAEKAGR